MSLYRRLAPEDIKINENPQEQFALDVLMGLSSKPKSLPPKYLYDAEGSRIFQEIMSLDEYYPTRCEKQILEKGATHIAEKVFGSPLNIIELGAGDGLKTKILLNELIQSKFSHCYCPVDISESAIDGLSKDLSSAYPALECAGLVADYFDALKWIRSQNDRRNFVLFLGSNIGNFSAPQVRVFLKTLWNSLNDGDFVFIGFDLKKDIDTLLHAYNDSKGVTHRFNLNLLERMNRELGANFDLKKFQHFGTYNVQLGAMESFIISTNRQTVEVPYLNRSFKFKAYEPIHVEFSFKFLREDVETLGVETGFTIESEYFDPDMYFMNVLFKVQKGENLPTHDH